MGQPAAKQNDQIIATDIHILMVPSPGGPVPTPIPHPFSGLLDNGLSTNVNIMGKPAATVGSTATNQPAHVPQGAPFQKQPTNQGKIIEGSRTVRINGQAAARNGDQTETCQDPTPNLGGQVVASGTVFIGD